MPIMNAIMAIMNTMMLIMNAMMTIMISKKGVVGTLVRAVLQAPGSRILF